MDIYKLNKKKIFFALFFLNLFFSSCFILQNKSVKNISNNKHSVDSFINKQFYFKHLSYKALINYKDRNNNYNFYATFDFVKDSAFKCVASLPLGIRIAEIYLDNDSSLFYFPLNKSYTFGDSLFFLNHYNLGLNFSSIQSLLTCSNFVYPFFIQYPSYSYITDSLYYLSQTVYNNRNSKIIDAQTTFVYDKDLNLIHSSINDNVLKEYLSIYYNNYQTVNSISFPSNFIIILSNSIDTISINMKIKNVDFKTSSNFNIIIDKDAKFIK